MMSDGSTVASVADRASYRLKTVTSQGLFQARAATGLSAVLAVGLSTHAPRRFHIYVHSNHHIPRHRPAHHEPVYNPTQQHAPQPDHPQRRKQTRRGCRGPGADVGKRGAICRHHRSHRPAAGGAERHGRHGEREQHDDVGVRDEPQQRQRRGRAKCRPLRPTPLIVVVRVSWRSPAACPRATASSPHVLPFFKSDDRGLDRGARWRGAASRE